MFYSFSGYWNCRIYNSGLNVWNGFVFVGQCFSFWLTISQKFVYNLRSKAENFGCNNVELVLFINMVLLTVRKTKSTWYNTIVIQLGPLRLWLEIRLCIKEHSYRKHSCCILLKRGWKVGGKILRGENYYN